LAPAEIVGLQRNDTELVTAAAGGDASAFHELVDRHSAHLYRLACMLSRTPADAEDIVQETFVGAFSGIAKFNGRASVKTWLSRILTRQAARAWHKSRRSRNSASLDEGGGMPMNDAGLSVSSTATAVDRKIDIAAELQRLSDEHREILVLREMQGLSYGEIAQTLGIPQGTVESRLHRARAEMRRRLQGYEP
jgi:RNA polymerase sigma-70 factor (ECF subfamily)